MITVEVDTKGWINVRCEGETVMDFIPSNIGMASRFSEALNIAVMMARNEEKIKTTFFVYSDAELKKNESGG